MSDPIDEQDLDRAGSESGYRPPSPALSFSSLGASLVGALIGYFVNWPIGAVLLVASIALGVVARKRHAEQRWAATLGIIISALCLLACFVVVSVVFYRAQQMTELLASS